MATPFYLTSTASDINPGAENELQLTLTRGSGVAAATTNTVLGPTTGVQVLVSGTAACWISLPLEPVTIAGTITFNLWGAENHNLANTTWRVLVERCSNAGAVLSTIVDSRFVTELTTTMSAKNWTAEPVSTALTSGDRLKVTVFGDDASTLEMGTGRTFTLDYNGTTATQDGDSYISFTETIVQVLAFRTVNVSDGVTLEETPAAQPGQLPQAVSDGVTLDETRVLLLPSLPLVASDGVSLSDSASVFRVSYGRPGLYSFAALWLGGAGPAVVTAGPTGADTVQVGDTPAVRLPFLLTSISESLALDDTASVVVSSLPLTVDDDVALDDTTLLLPTLVPSVSDEVSVADAPAVVLSFLPCSVSDSVALEETAEALLPWLTLERTETCAVEDTAAALLPMLPSAVSDDVLVDETRTVSRGMESILSTGALTDGLTLEDAATLLVPWFVPSASDDVTLEDAVLVYVSFLTLSISDTVALEDASILLVPWLTCAVDEPLAISELLSMLVPLLHLTASNEVLVSEDRLVQRPVEGILLCSPVPDTVTLEDTATLRVPMLFLAVADAVMLEDQVENRLPFLLLAVTDTLAIQELPGILLPRLLTTVDDTLLVDESKDVLRQLPNILNTGELSDGVTVEDTVVLVLPFLLLTGDDEVLVADDRTVTLGVEGILTVPGASASVALDDTAVLRVPWLVQIVASAVLAEDSATVLVPWLVPSIAESLALTETALAHVPFLTSATSDSVTLDETRMLRVPQLFAFGTASLLLEEDRNVTGLLPGVNISQPTDDIQVTTTVEIRTWLTYTVSDSIGVSEDLKVHVNLPLITATQFDVFSSTANTATSRTVSNSRTSVVGTWYIVMLSSMGSGGAHDLSGWGVVAWEHIASAGNLYAYVGRATSQVTGVLTVSNYTGTSTGVSMVATALGGGVDTTDPVIGTPGTANTTGTSGTVSLLSYERETSAALVGFRVTMATTTPVVADAEWDEVGITGHATPANQVEVQFRVDSGTVNDLTDTATWGGTSVAYNAIMLEIAAFPEVHTLAVSDDLTLSEDRTVQHFVYLWEIDTPVDALSVDDAVLVQGLLLTPAVAELLTLNDSVTVRGLTLTCAVTDPVTVSESRTVVRGVEGMLTAPEPSEHVALSEMVPVRLPRLPLVVADTVALSEALLQRLPRLPLLATATLALADTAVVIPHTGPVHVTETVVVADDRTAFLPFLACTVSDGISLTEPAPAFLTVTYGDVRALDLVALSESTDVIVCMTVTVSDTVQVGDTALMGGRLAAEGIDALAADDTVHSYLLVQPHLQDLISLEEALLFAVPLRVSQASTVLVSDAILMATNIHYVTALDTVALASAVTLRGLSLRGLHGVSETLRQGRMVGTLRQGTGTTEVLRQAEAEEEVLV